MSVMVEKKKHEWIVSESSGVSVCIGVENGVPGSAKVNGLSELTCADGPIYTNLTKLQALWKALTELLQEVRASEERTKPKEE